VFCLIALLTNSNSNPNPNPTPPPFSDLDICHVPVISPYSLREEKHHIGTMALQTAYKRFLASPNASFLAPNVSLHYITTLVTFNGSADIINHLNGQNYELQKKEEKFLDVVESTSAIAVEIHTCIEFLAGGGAYLPSLDDNFLADRTVTLPIVC